jgi:signal transduction histidine kinase/ActR/RegA family two-component response regulator
MTRTEAIEGSRAAGGEPADLRVLAVALTPRDASLLRAVLADVGVPVRVCSSLGELCSSIADGAGALLLPEEAIDDPSWNDLARLLAEQPSWSDLPLLVLTQRGADSSRVTQAVGAVGNVTLLERPTRVSALVSAVRTAQRARERQYLIRELIASHERAAAALREADRRKDEFLAMLAHELRNPLAPIRNSLYLLREIGADAQIAVQLRDRIERQVDVIVRLVDDLLEVSRITRGQIELRPETVDLAAVLDAALETCGAAVEAAGLELAVDVPPHSLWVFADPLRLAQVFTNLLNNSIKFTDRGGRIEVSARRAAGGVRVAVRDTGIGIRGDMLERVFEMFAQADEARHRGSTGLGIGLTLVRRILDLHGGEIEAQSAGPGRGSEFVVRLPSAAAPEAGGEPAPPAGAPGELLDADLSPLSALVVDDNRDAADSLAMLLETFAVETRVAYSGSAALELLDAYRPGVALLDIGLPDMSGHELAAHLRARSELRPLALIALTGWGQADVRRRSREAGFDHHLVKPVAPRALRALLGSLVAKVGGAGSSPGRG